MRIVEVLEGHQFVFQVRRRPEQQLIHAFSSQRADQPFDNGCDSGTYGTLFTSVTCSTRRLARHW